MNNNQNKVSWHNFTEQPINTHSLVYHKERKNGCDKHLVVCLNQVHALATLTLGSQHSQSATSYNDCIRVSS